MARSERSEMLSEIRKDGQKSSDRTLILASVLVVIHLLNISPSELEALGAKFTLNDPVILRGTVSVIFLHEVHTLTLLMRSQFAYGGATTALKQIGRSTLLRRRKIGRSIKTIKFLARLEMIIWNILAAPYFVSLAVVLVSAFILSIMDAIQLAQYCYTSTTAGKALKVFLLS